VMLETGATMREQDHPLLFCERSRDVALIESRSGS
jgi:hypothetical protein